MRQAGLFGLLSAASDYNLLTALERTRGWRYNSITIVSAGSTGLPRRSGCSAIEGTRWKWGSDFRPGAAIRGKAGHCLPKPRQSHLAILSALPSQSGCFGPARPDPTSPPARFTGSQHGICSSTCTSGRSRGSGLQCLRPATRPMRPIPLHCASSDCFSKRVGLSVARMLATSGDVGSLSTRWQWSSLRHISIH